MVDEERVLVMNLRELFDAAGAADVRPQMCVMARTGLPTVSAAILLQILSGENAGSTLHCSLIVSIRRCQ